jgi:16S rRNA processing protein RimM
MGTIVSPVGINGTVRIMPRAVDPERFIRCDKLCFADGTKVHLKKQKLSRGGTVTAKIIGCDDRNVAEALRKKELFLGEESRTSLGEDDLQDLSILSMRVVDDSGEELGVIESIRDFGAGSILELKLQPSGKRVYIPYNKDAVTNINFETGTMAVNTEFLV